MQSVQNNKYSVKEMSNSGIYMYTFNISKRWHPILH